MRQDCALDGVCKEHRGLYEGSSFRHEYIKTMSQFSNRPMRSYVEETENVGKNGFTNLGVLYGEYRRWWNPVRRDGVMCCTVDGIRQEVWVYDSGK